MKIPTKPEPELKIKIHRDAALRILEAGGKVEIPVAMIEAVRWVNEGRTSFKLSDAAWDAIGDRWHRHADRFVIIEWLQSKGATGDIDVIYFVCAHVLSEWSAKPDRTLTQHRKLYRDIEATATKLVALLDTTGDRYYRGGGQGLQNARIHELFNDAEKAAIFDTVEAWNEGHPIGIDEYDRPVIVPPSEQFPTVEQILERVASAARRLHDAGPIHSQPNKHGAMNGYFIRRMDALLRGRYGECPAGLLAAIATIALDATIDADLVQKAVALSERSNKKKRKNVR